MAKAKKDRKKDKALKLLAEGKFSKARTMLEKILETKSQDYRLWLRLGDTCRKLEDTDGAVEAYRKAARGFSHEGFLVQAIACHKQVLELKPDDETIHEELSELYEQRGMTYVRPGEERLIVSSPRAGTTGSVSKPAPSPEPEPSPVPDPHEIELEEPPPEPVRPRVAPPEHAIPVTAVDDSSLEDQMPEIWTDEKKSAPPESEPPEDLIIEEDGGLAAAIAEAAAEVGDGDDGDEELALDEELKEAAAPGEESTHFEIEMAPPAPVDLPPVPLLTDLKPDELHLLIEQLVRSVRPAGEVVCQEGDPGDSLFLISRGRVGIYGRTPDGDDELLAELGEGDFFGEFALMSTHRRQATVKTLEETELLEVSQATFQHLIDEHPRVREVALEYYRTRIVANLDQRCALFRALPPESREKVLEFGEHKVFLEGSPILREGMRGEALYIVADGEVEARINFGEDTLRMGRLGAGEFFGEISALTGNPCTADVFALSRVEVVAFEREQAMELIKVFPALRTILERYRERRVHRSLHELEAALSGEEIAEEGGEDG